MRQTAHFRLLPICWGFDVFFQKQEPAFRYVIREAGTLSWIGREEESGDQMVPGVLEYEILQSAFAYWNRYWKYGTIGANCN